KETRPGAGLLVGALAAAACRRRQMAMRCRKFADLVAQRTVLFGEIEAHCGDAALALSSRLDNARPTAPIPMVGANGRVSELIAVLPGRSCFSGRALTLT